jgi:hypothetical protein
MKTRRLACPKCGFGELACIVAVPSTELVECERCKAVYEFHRTLGLIPVEN